MAKPIAIHTPKRREGQHNVLGLTTEPLPVVRVGIVGLGERGMKAVRRFCDIDHACVTAVCDVSPQRADEASQLLGSLGQSANVVAGVDAYKDLCLLKEVDLIYICTDWTSHVDVACGAVDGDGVYLVVPGRCPVRASLGVRY
jgi:predicted homoserine dehydrogenase-like protein